MLNLADYHIHTKRCGHAVGEMEEYVEVALQRGLREMGFSDHLPLVTHRDPGLTMAEEELPLYVENVMRLREKYPQITIRLGIEADYIEGYEEKTRLLLESYDWDYVIGSVHIISGWEFDHPDGMEEWARRDVDEVYRCYYRLLRQSAQCGLFDIIGHSDLVKKFGHRPHSDMMKEVEQTAQTFRDCGMVVELNTSGLRKPVEEMYPAFSILQVYQKYGLPLLISSDSHQPDEVGQDFDLAMDWARRAGYEETVTFAGRKVEQYLNLPQEKTLKTL